MVLPLGVDQPLSKNCPRNWCPKHEGPVDKASLEESSIETGLHDLGCRSQVPVPVGWRPCENLAKLAIPCTGSVTAYAPENKIAQRGARHGTDQSNRRVLEHIRP